MYSLASIVSAWAVNSESDKQGPIVFAQLKQETNRFSPLYCLSIAVVSAPVSPGKCPGSLGGASATDSNNS